MSRKIERNMSGRLYQKLFSGFGSRFTFGGLGAFRGGRCGILCGALAVALRGDGDACESTAAGRRAAVGAWRRGCGAAVRGAALGVARRCVEPSCLRA